MRYQKLKPRSKRLAVIDFETDPFGSSGDISPFLSGAYDGETMATWWGPNCAESLVRWIQKQPEDTIFYARNGGRFDFFYMMPWIDRRELNIIDTRIVRCWLGGRHQLRDSYSLMPFSLRDYKKADISYKIFHRDSRESHKPEIQQYHALDLRYEFDLVSRWVEEFGDGYLTLGALSAVELRKFCPYWRGGAAYDHEFRERFFLGGRNELYKSGVFDGDIKMIDVVSMYPDVMRSIRHPVGTKVEWDDRIHDDTVFLTVAGKNYGAFPIRHPDTRELDFTATDGIFHVSIHEFNAALETGTFVPDRVIETFSWLRTSDFSPFVDRYSEKRYQATKTGDRAGELIYKYVQNGAYGKFAQNPAGYSDHFLTQYGRYPTSPGDWGMAYTNQANRSWSIWEKPAKFATWYNVATAASITGAARAKLLRGLCDASGVLYCDTDSIISRDSPLSYDTSGKIGSWRLEVSGTRVSFVQKKVYAIWNGETCVKKANAGCILTPDEIQMAAEGRRLNKIDTRPTFGLDGSIRFLKHTVRRSA